MKHFVSRHTPTKYITPQLPPNYYFLLIDSCSRVRRNLSCEAFCLTRSAGYRSFTVGKKGMRACKQCRDDLTSENCAFTGNCNAKTHQRYMDNVCKFCKQSQTRQRLNLMVLHPRPPPDTPCDCCGRIAPLHMDHCHSSREFRGYLCRQCNHGIGHLGDDLEGVQKAMVYLQRCQIN